MSWNKKGSKKSEEKSEPMISDSAVVSDIPADEADQAKKPAKSAKKAKPAKPAKSGKAQTPKKMDKYKK